MLITRDLSAQCNLGLSISTTADSVLASIPIGFSGSVGGGIAPYQYEWNFGDGNSSFQVSPSHSFTTSGCGIQIFQVKLKVTDSNSCTDSVTKLIYIKGSPEPELQDVDLLTPFSNCDNNPSQSNPNFTISLLNKTKDSAAVSSYLIDWGDGTAVQTIYNTSSPINHTYQSLGLFTVSFSAISNQSCTATTSYFVTNQGNPAIGLSSSGNTQGCAPQTFKFVLSQYQYNAPGTYYVWDFGDGTPMITWNYSDPFINDTITHTFNTSSCSQTGTTFTAKVTAYNQCDFTTLSVGNIRIYSPPVASFVPGADTICVNNQVCFQNNTISGFGYNCNSMATYSWNFGDSASTTNTSTLANPCHTYTQPGTYLVTLTTGNTICGSSQLTKPIVVLSPPMALATPDTNFGCVPFSISTNNNSSGGGLIYTWSHSPGSGIVMNGSSSQSNPAFTFNQPGTSHIYLSAQNLCGTSNTSFTINAASMPQISIFSIPNSCGSKTLQAGISANSNNSPINSYNWSFPGGNPSSSTLSAPTSYYNVQGTYAVSIIAGNQCGFDTAVQSFTVHPLPVISLTSVSNPICEGDTSVITAGGGQSYQWAPANGLNTLSGNIVTASPAASTIYHVTATDANNCQSADSIQINVNPLPILQINPSTAYICIGDSVQLNVSGAISYQWTPSPVLSSLTSSQVYATPVQNSIFTVKGTDINGCSDTISALVNVSQHLTINLSPNLLQLCHGDSLALSASGANSFFWSPASGLSATTGNTIIASPLSTTSYTLTGFNSLGCSSDTSFILTVNSKPSLAVIASNDTICSGQSVQLTAIGSGTFQWSGPSLSSFSGSNVSVSPLTSATYRVTITDINGCSSTDSIHIIVNPSPQVQLSVSTTQICIGDTVIMQASGTLQYQWSGNALFSNSGNLTSAAPGVTSTYTLIATDSAGCSQVQQTTIVVNPLPQIQPSILSPSICMGDSVQISLNVAVAYQLSPAIGYNQANQNTFSFSPAATTSYTITGTSSFGCINSINLALTVNPNPTAIATASQTSICAGQSTVLSGSGGQSFSWSPSQGFTNPSASIVIAQPSSNQYYTLTVIDSNGCQDKDSILIQVSQAINLQINATTTAICQDDTLSLIVSGALNYQWTGINLSNTTGNTVQVFPQASTVYTVVGTDSNGCSNQSQIPITVYPKPVVSISSTATDICSGDSVTLTAGGASTYQWVAGGGLLNTIGSGVIAVPQSTHQYIVSGTDTSGCVSISTKNIIVHALPVLTITTSSAAICKFDTVFLSVSGAQIYQWSGNSLINTQTQTVAANPLSSSIYNVVGTDSFGCKSTASISVTVNNLPVVTTNPANPSICRGESTIITAAGASFYNWSPATGLNTNQGSQVVASPLANTFYHILATDSNGCKSQTGVNVTVLNIPNVSYTHDSVVCKNAVVAFTNYSSGATQFLWNFGDGNISTNSNPVHSYATAGYYTVKLVSMSGLGCGDSISSVIQVIELPVNNFQLSSDSGCTPLQVQFNNLCSGHSPIYSWQLGNGSSCNQKFPAPQVYSQGLHQDTVYQVCLTATNICGSSIQCKPLKVFALPEAHFGVSPNEGCSPLTVSFGNNSMGNPGSYLWNFGNGNSGTMTIPAPITYTAGLSDSIYTVCLTATNQCGSDTSSKQIRVKPQSVTSFFTSSSNSGCAPFNVSFTNYSTLNASIHWSFGDGNNSTSFSPAHTYMLPGIYQVSLIVGDSCSSDTSTTVITVHPPAQLYFSLSSDSICAGESVIITNNSQGISSCSWSFGDGGNSNLTNPTHTYSSPGNYTIMMKSLAQTSGCIDSTSKSIFIKTKPDAQFSLSASNGCMPLALAFTNSTANATYYQWTYGDGNGSVSANPSHTYTFSGTYTAQLVATHIDGCTDTSISTVVVYPKPHSQFSMNTNSVCKYPEGPVLTNQSNGAHAYLWDFDNGVFSSLTTPTVTYNTPGSYNIQLIATNQYSCSDTSMQIFMINDPPQASFTLSATEGCPTHSVSFNNNSTGHIINCHWSFGDGSTGSGLSISHNYLSSGLYTVSMIAEGNGGCRDTLVLLDTVFVYPKPIPVFIWENTNIPQANAGSVQFTNSSANADTYFWDFGDGLNSSIKNPLHQYTYDGSYMVTLTASNSFGCISSIERNIEVDLIKGLFIPNAFSPENPSPDVRVFMPKGKGLKEFCLSIYDSWGNKIWETRNLDEHGRPGEGWDGSHMGKPMPQDVYVWKATAIFEDNSIWQGMDNGKGELRSYGTLVLIR